MAAIKDILSILRDFAPERDTEPDFDDNVGLIIGSENSETDKVLLCLDCTENVVEEAARLNAKLIISHHPAIFLPIKSVTDEDPTGRMILAAAKNGITVYSAHTNLDFCKGGLNDYAAELAGLKNVSEMETLDGIAVGRVGDSDKITLGALAAKLAKNFDDGHVRVVGDKDAEIRKIAIINGGAGSLRYVRLAADCGADCYVTADVPHHVLLFAAQSGMNMIIMQHYAMEAVYLKRLAEILTKSAAERGIRVGFQISESEYDPVGKERL